MENYVIAEIAVNAAVGTVTVIDGACVCSAKAKTLKAQNQGCCTLID